MPPEEPNPERIVKTPHSNNYDTGYYKCNTSAVEYKGFTVTVWTEGALYSPGYGIDGFIRIEAASSRAESDVDEFHPGNIHAAALRFSDQVQVRKDDQHPHFYHVRRERLGLEAHLVDMVSTSSIRVGQGREKYLPCGQYLLELTVQKGTKEFVQIKNIYIEVLERHKGSIFDPARLRKAGRPTIAIPAVRGDPIDEQIIPDRR